MSNPAVDHEVEILKRSVQIMDHLRDGEWEKAEALVSRLTLKEWIELPSPADWLSDPAEAATRALEVINNQRRREALDAGDGELGRMDVPLDPDPPEWIVNDWLPANRVAFVSGRGGAGKSRLLLQLACAVAGSQDGQGSGKAFLFGGGEDRMLNCAGGPVVYATWEDNEDVFGWRLKRLFEHAQGWGEERCRERLHVIDMASLGPVWAPAAGGHTSTRSTLTSAGDKLRRYAAKVGAVMMIVDPLAAAYASNENDRGLVREFMSSTDAWARANGCAVVLVSHPAKTTEGEGATYSGSTDWRNAARAAWVIQNRKVPGTDEREPCLSLDKSSYGPLPAPIWLNSVGTVWEQTDAPEEPEANVGGRAKANIPDEKLARFFELMDAGKSTSAARKGAGINYSRQADAEAQYHEHLKSRDV